MKATFKATAWGRNIMREATEVSSILITITADNLDEARTCAESYTVQWLEDFLKASYKYTLTLVNIED